MRRRRPTADPPTQPPEPSSTIGGSVVLPHGRASRPDRGGIPLPLRNPEGLPTGAPPPEELERLLAAARGGDPASREILLAACRPFVELVASDVCRRRLDWRNDDELSVAWLALDEAIAGFRPEVGTPFFAYARLVIRRRLVDHFRREAPNRHLPLEYAEEGDADPALTAAEIREGWRRFADGEAERARALEIERLQGVLRPLGISLWDLADLGPRHADTRRALLRAARCLAGRGEWLSEARRTGRLPMAALARESGVSRKAIQRGRRFILVAALIWGDPAYEELRRFFAEPESPLEGSGGEGGGR